MVIVTFNLVKSSSRIVLNSIRYYSWYSFVLGIAGIPETLILYGIL